MLRQDVAACGVAVEVRFDVALGVADRDIFRADHHAREEEGAGPPAAVQAVADVAVGLGEEVLLSDDNGYRFAETAAGHAVREIGIRVVFRVAFVGWHDEVVAVLYLDQILNGDFRFDSTSPRPAWGERIVLRYSRARCV